MAKDKNDNAWFSLYGEGIYQWDSKQKKFIKHLQGNENAWLTSKKTFEILIDSKNRLWVCTIDSKVFLYEIDSGQSKVFDFSSDENDPLSSPIYGFAESKNGELYAGGYSGVFKYNEDSQSFDVLIDESLLTEHYGHHVSVTKLLVDSKNNLWIGTNNSLLQYSRQALNSIVFYEDGDVIQSNFSTRSITESHDGNIWIGTEGQGLIKLAADLDRYDVYISEKKEPVDIRLVYKFQDNIWLVHPSSKIDLLAYENNHIKLKKTTSQFRKRQYASN